MSSYLSLFFFFFPRIFQEILFFQSNTYNSLVTGRDLEYAKLCSEKRRQEKKEKKDLQYYSSASNLEAFGFLSMRSD